MAKDNDQSSGLEQSGPVEDNLGGGDTNEPIRALATRLRDAVEMKDWPGLQSLFAFPTVWVENAAMPVPEFVQKAQTVLGEAEDIEFVLSRVLQVEGGETSGRASFTVRLLWSAAKTWAETEVEFDLHLGFEKTGEEWRFTFLGVTRPRQGHEAQTGAPTEYFGGYFHFQDVLPQYFEAAATLGRYFQDFPQAAAQVGRYFTEATVTPPYFGATAIPTMPTQPPPAAAPKLVLCYMPVLLPTDVARSLFNSDS